MPKYLALLAPVGAALFLAFASLTPYYTMEGIGALMEANQTLDLPKYHLVGECGLIAFGIGFICAIHAYGSSNRSSKGFVVGAAFAFGLAVILTMYGTRLLSTAFMRLATAETVESELFLDGVVPAKYPLLAGGFFVFVGGMLISIAGWNPRRRHARTGLSGMIACFCGFVLLVSAIWSLRSFHSAQFALQEPQMIEPAQVAHGVMGMFQSNYLSLVSIFGCAVACLLALGDSETADPSD